MGRGLLGVALLLAGAGCARRGPTGGALYAASASTDPVGDHYARIRGDLEKRGYAPIAEPTRGDVAGEGLLTFPLEMQGGSCYALVALGGPGIVDLDLYLFDASMRQLGRNTRPDAHPWLVHCPTAPARTTARLRGYRGTGPFLFAAFHGPAGLGDISEIVSAGLLQAPPPAVDGQAAERIARSDVEMSKAGSVRAGPAITLKMVRGEVRPIPVNLTQGACYALVSFAGTGMGDSDLFLVTPAGTEASRDVRHSRDATIRVCAASTGAYQLQVKANRGDGQVYVLAYGPTAAAVIAAAGDIAPEPGAAVASAAAPASPADEAFRSLDSDVRARGYEPVGEPVLGDASTAQPVVFEMPLEADNCYAVAAATTQGGEIEVHLKTSRGNAIEAEVSAGSATIVRACADGNGPHRIEVGLRRANGPVIAQAYRWPRSTRGPFGLAGVPFVRLAEATSLLSLEGYEPLGAPESSDLREGAVSTYPIAFETPVCHAVVGVGGLGVDEVDLQVAAGGADDRAGHVGRADCDRAGLSAADRGSLGRRALDARRGARPLPALRRAGRGAVAVGSKKLLLNPRSFWYLGGGASAPHRARSSDGSEAAAGVALPASRSVQPRDDHGG